MAMCKYCPFIDPESDLHIPELEVDEWVAFGNGCPDKDYDVGGGDCFDAFAPPEMFEDEDDEVMSFKEFELYYNAGEVKATKGDKNAGI